MKTILVAIVLGVAAFAAAQDAAQPAQQPAGQPQQQVVIKDPAEYNAYVSAYQQKDPTAQISGLEAFLTQYPNSVMKNQALEILMGAYQTQQATITDAAKRRATIQKVMDTANKLLASDTCNERALALLAYWDRALAQGGDPAAQQELTDGKKSGEQGLSCFDKVTDPEIKKMQPQMTPIFKSIIGLDDLQTKDYSGAIENLRAAVDATPGDFSIVYPLALAYWPDAKTPTTPENSMNAIWYAGHASGVAPASSQPAIEKYARSLYIRYHGGDDGWPDVLAKAKAGATPPADLSTLIKPAPTPADQAHTMAASKDPKEMDFAMWEFILQNGSQDDRDKVWNAIKGQSFQLNGTVIKASATEFDIAASLDDIDAKQADVTLTFEASIPKTRIPKEGASLDFEGSPASYTPSPFMMTMEKGKLAAPKPSPAHHAAPRKPASGQ